MRWINVKENEKREKKIAKHVHIDEWENFVDKRRQEKMDDHVKMILLAMRTVRTNANIATQTFFSVISFPFVLNLILIATNKLKVNTKRKRRRT